MTDGISRYAEYLGRVNKDNLDDLKKLCTEDIHFRDPFNNVKSVEAYIAIMGEAYEMFSDVRFEVLDVFRSGDSNTAVIKWNFHFRTKKGKTECITGLSEVFQNTDGKIATHLDYWDSGERIYAKIPLVGGLIRFIRSKVSAGLDQVRPV